MTAAQFAWAASLRSKCSSTHNSKQGIEMISWIGKGFLLRPASALIFSRAREKLSWASRSNALAVIQLLVYPAAYPTHGVWAAVLLWLMVRGPGAVSIDHALAVRRNRSTAG